MQLYGAIWYAALRINEFVIFITQFVKLAFK